MQHLSQDLFLPSSSFLSNGSNELVEDIDGSKTRAAIEHIHCKISKTRDQIRGEQTARDGKYTLHFVA